MENQKEDSQMVWLRDEKEPDNLSLEEELDKQKRYISIKKELQGNHFSGKTTPKNIITFKRTRKRYLE